MPIILRGWIEGSIDRGYLSTGRAALIGGLVALSCYVGSLRNGWAMDDELIIAVNPASQSISHALDSFFEPYWPEESGIQAGQYRPLAILWFSIDWTISGGNPSWFHGVNIVLHAVATVLFVFVVGKWLPPIGALAAGLVFGVHPVHVEAVANVIGRSEVATTVGLLGAVLCARRFRSRWGWSRSFWLAAVLSLLAVSLLMKENAVVLLGLLLLDELSEGDAKSLVKNLSMYLAVATVTLAWLYLWRGVAGQFVASSQTAALRNVPHFERLSTMFPAYLDVSRLLFWPMDLASDYNPQMILRRTGWSLMATLGLVHTTAVILLAWMLRHRALAVAVAVFASVITFAPASNLIFSSGVLLAERSLYLAVWAPAVVSGWLVWRASVGRWRLPMTATLGVVTLVFAARAVQRVPDWQSTEQIVTTSFAEDPENYRAHLRVGSLLLKAGDSSGALAQWLVAGEIFPDDPFVTLVTSPLARDLGRLGLAFREAERGLADGVEYPELIRSAVRARLTAGFGDSALAAARIGVERHPMAPMASESYAEVLRSVESSPWRVSFARARDDWIHGQLGMASQNLRTGSRVVSTAVIDSSECWDISQTMPLLEMLTADWAERVRQRVVQAGSCTLP